MTEPSKVIHVRNVGHEISEIVKEYGGIMRFIQVSCLGASPSSTSSCIIAALRNIHCTMI